MGQLLVILWVFVGILRGISAQEEVNNVIEITQENMDLGRMKREKWMLFFGSPLCPHCMRFLSTWKLFADMALEDGVRVGAVNCLEDPDVCGYFGITKYPSIVYVKDGRYWEFEGERSIQNMTEFYTEGHLGSSGNQLVGSKKAPDLVTNSPTLAVWKAMTFEGKIKALIPLPLTLLALWGVTAAIPRRKKLKVD
jgi:thiol-disulfide isomerase/thioredoxin